MKVNFYIQSCYISLSLPIFVILFLSSPLSQSVVTVIMQLTLISLLLINKFRLLELEIEFTRQRLGIGTRVEAAQVFSLLRPHHWFSKFSLFVVFRFLQTQPSVWLLLISPRTFFLENIILLSISFWFLCKRLRIQSVFTVIMQLTLISSLSINKFRLWSWKLNSRDNV